MSEKILKTIKTKNEEKLVNDIKDVIISSRKKVTIQVNEALVTTYWQIGRLIVEHEQEGEERAQYGEMKLTSLANKLSIDFGSGFSARNLRNMRRFYLLYPIWQAVPAKLGWTNICELMTIENEEKRKFYEKECVNSKWSSRELKRQISSCFFERLLLSKGEVNKQEVYELSQKGHEISKPEDILRDPYVFEFLGLPENRPILEKDLEDSLVRHLENFLLELGKGFMYVGRQQRVTLGNTHYYVDMVFYNKILKAYVLIDLKMTNIKPEHFGQMNMYVNYYNAEIKDENDNPTIGMLLCTEKDRAVVEYSIGGLENKIFASKYIPYLPNKNLLIAEVEKVIELKKRLNRKEDKSKK